MIIPNCGAFSPPAAQLGQRKNSWNPSTKHLLEHMNHHFQLVWHYRRHSRAPMLTQVTRGQAKPPGEEAGRDSAQLPPTAGTRTPTLPCVPHPLVSQGQQHTAREGPSLSQPHCVEMGTPASCPAPAENICCSQLLAAKCHGLASTQPELVLYKPLIALKHEVLIPSTLPLLYKGYSSAPTGSVPFPSKLKLAASCAAQRAGCQCSPPAPVGQSNRLPSATGKKEPVAATEKVPCSEHLRAPFLSAVALTQSQTSPCRLPVGSEKSPHSSRQAPSFSPSGRAPRRSRPHHCPTAADRLRSPPKR